jgi:hypothetical protein
MISGTEISNKRMIHFCEFTFRGNIILEWVFKKGYLPDAIREEKNLDLEIINSEKIN